MVSKTLSTQKNVDGKPCDRKDFLRQAGAGLLAVSVFGEHSSLTPNNLDDVFEDEIDETVPVKFPPIEASSEQALSPTPSPLRPNKRVGFAIVGLGRLALNQVLPAIAKCKYAKVVALVSGDSAKAKKVAYQYGIPEKYIYNYSSFDQIKNNSAINAVYIILPNSMHEEFVIRSAKAGKHVLCEKPMATSVAAAERMIEACKMSNVKLMIAYRIQYEPNHRQMMKWVRDKHFGKIKVINSFNGQNTIDPEHWRFKKALAGGGSLPDIGLYNLNTARFLLGEEPEMVNATIYSSPGDPRFTEVEESVMFQLMFPGGTIASNTCSYGVHQSRYYRCHGDNGGWLGVNNAFAYGGLQMEISKAEGKLENKINPMFGSSADQFATEIDHMAECILFNKTPYTPGEEGLQDQKIMTAIYESARTGRPVKLPSINTLDTFRGDLPREV